MFGWLKLAGGFLGAYRIWIMSAAIVAALLSIMVFYGNAQARKVELAAANELIGSLRFDLQAARVELDARNQRIRDMNARQLEELRHARDLLNQSLRMSAVLREERDDLKQQLEENRFELLEAIRDDEDMADWVDYDVPAVAWGLLQQAAQARPRGELRADH